MVLVLDVVGQQLCSVGGVPDASVSVFLFLPARWLRLRFRLWFQLWQTVGEKYYSICKEPKREGAHGAQACERCKNSLVPKRCKYVLGVGVASGGGGGGAGVGGARVRI